MRAFTLFSAFVAVAVSSVLATPGSTPAALIARQATAIPDIPAECQSACATIQKITTCGADLSCMCTNAMGQGMVDCGTCGIKFHGSDPNIAQYKAQFQTSVNSYADACTSAGYKIGPFDVLGSSSGGSPAPSPSAGSGSASGTGTGAAAPASTKSPNSATSVHTGGAFVGLVGVVMALVL